MVVDTAEEEGEAGGGKSKQISDMIRSWLFHPRSTNKVLHTYRNHLNEGETH